MGPKRDKSRDGKPTDGLDMFESSIGSWGRWQTGVLCLILLCKFPVGWHQLNILIIGKPPIVTCASNASLHACDDACTEIVVDPYPFDLTIITQWELVCQNHYLSTLVQMFTMLGILVGNAIWGYWADKKGRCFPLTIALLIQAVTGSICAFMPWFWAFMFFRFLSAVATGGSMCTSFVLLMEITGKKWRVLMSAIYQVPTWLAHLSLALIGYYVRDWRYSQLIISAPSFLLVIYFFLLPESPRYLVNTGQPDRAIRIMERAAKRNGLPSDDIDSTVRAYVAAKEAAKAATDAPPVKGRCADLFNSRTMALRTFVLSMAWIACGLCFYGVAQYVGMLAGNIFINITISASVETPATLCTILFLSFMGRKWSQFVACMFAGLPMLLIPVLPAGIWSTVMAAIALFGLTILFTTVYLYTSELYPTYIRSLGVGITSMTARIGSIVAPFISALVRYDFGVWFAPVVFGVFPIIAGVLTLFLPETRYSALPETLEDAKNLGKKSATPAAGD